ncbi:UNVERIFIED_CONTAM: hypothetical protein Cloal_0104 [Acetivibrio alkalicellulosi]
MKRKVFIALLVAFVVFNTLVFSVNSPVLLSKEEFNQIIKDCDIPLPPNPPEPSKEIKNNLYEFASKSDDISLRNTPSVNIVQRRHNELVFDVVFPYSGVYGNGVFIYNYALGEWITLSSWYATNGRYRYSGIGSSQYYLIHVVYYNCPSYSWNRREINVQTSTLSRNNFSAFYIGNYTDSDYTAFRDGMISRGFSTYAARTTHSPFISGRPNGSLIRSATPNSEFVYISGHGHRRADLPIYQSHTTQAYQTLCAASAATNLSLPTYEIGATWQGANSMTTNSIWNRDTKWVIMSACSQLDHYNVGSLGIIWDNSTASQLWARTLLGSAYRAHGILGYFYQGPYDTDVQVIEDFLELAYPDWPHVPFTDIIYSWKQANEWSMGVYGSNWAAVYHAEHEASYMNNIGPSTVSGSSSTIYRRSRIQGFPWDDVIILPLSRNTSLSFSEDNTSDKSVEKITVDNRKFVFRKVNEQNNVEKINLKNTQHKNINYDQIAEKLFGSRVRNNSINELNYYKNDNKFLQIFDDGRIEFRDIGIEKSTEEKIDSTPSEMVYNAKEFLKTLDLLPDKNYEIHISTVGRNPLYIDGNPVKEDITEIVEYNIIFLQTHNGIPIVSDEGEGISVRINSNGIKNFKYSWRKVDEQKSKHNIIEQSIAIDSYINSFNQLFKTPIEEKFHVAELSLMYYDKDGKIVPVWAFEFGDVRNISLIDATTGKKLR